MGKPRNESLTPFSRTLGISDFGISSDKTLIDGEYTRVGRFTVGAQQEATFGITVSRSGGGEGEPVFLRMIDSSGNDIDATVRFRITNAQTTTQEDVLEQRMVRLRADKNDRTKAFLLSEYRINAVEDSELVVDVKQTTGSNVTWDHDATNSEWIIPTTIYQ